MAPLRNASLPGTADTKPQEDHRVRVAREKRKRMRAHLMQSIIAVCSGRKLTGSTVIEDVVRHAEVSRGTFYKYFETLDEAVIEIASELAEEMTVGISSVYDVLDDPILRTATGFQTFLSRSLIDPNWGAFIIHLDLLNGEQNQIASKVKGDIRLGIQTGDYFVKSVDTAADLLMGAKHEAIRRIIAGEHDVSYIQDMAAMVLKSFGVSHHKAEKSVVHSFERLCKLAPAKLSWWKTDGPAAQFRSAP
ncbi:TetR/AcrR family transcriptional regulator [Sphingobium subterraneum]|nr:TetR/AcrR family transcriptional regulator [Sphingobium subterraneum]